MKTYGEHKTQKVENPCKSKTYKGLNMMAEWTGPTVKTAVFPLCSYGWQHKNTKKTDTNNATTLAGLERVFA